MVWHSLLVIWCKVDNFVFCWCVVVWVLVFFAFFFVRFGQCGLCLDDCSFICMTWDWLWNGLWNRLWNRLWNSLWILYIQRHYLKRLRLLSVIWLFLYTILLYHFLTLFLNLLFDQHSTPSRIIPAILLISLI